MAATTEVAEAFVEAAAGDAPAYNAPYSRADLRKLEDTAHDLMGMVEIFASRIEGLNNARAGFGHVSRQDLALCMAEMLDPHLTSEAVGVVFAEIRAAFASAERLAA